MTDTARDRWTGRIVSATELWLLETVDEKGYICRACTILMEPTSYKKDVNKKRPYFRLYRKTDHDVGCGVVKSEKIKAEARTRSVFHEEGFPTHYPNELVLEDRQVRRGRPTNNITCGTGSPGTTGQVGSSGEPSSKVHNHTTDTIRPLAQTYLDYPFDRDKLKLRVPGVNGSTYEEIFQHVFFTEDTYFPEPKIFYGSIRFNNIKVQENYADVTLSEGRWERIRGKNELIQPQIVRIHMEDWPRLMREFVLDDIKVARNEMISAYEKKQVKTKGNLLKGWLFFVGEQDSENRFLFHVKDHRLICCIPDVMVRTSARSPYTKKSSLPTSNTPSLDRSTEQFTSGEKLEDIARTDVERPRKLNEDNSSRTPPVFPYASQQKQALENPPQPNTPNLQLRNLETHARGKVDSSKKTINNQSESSSHRSVKAIEPSHPYNPAPRTTIWGKVRKWLRRVSGNK